MTYNEAIAHLRAGLLSNISNVKLTSDKNLMTLLNSGILNLHSVFNLRFEQAIIFVKDGIKNYTIDGRDECVVINSYKEFLKGNDTVEKLMNRTGYKVKLPYTQEQRSKSIPTNRGRASVVDEIGTSEVTDTSKVLGLVKQYPVDNLIPEDIIVTDPPLVKVPDEQDRTKRPDVIVENTKVLKILDISDNVDTDYILNHKNVFQYNMIDNQLYFPNCEEGNVIYVEYKPLPDLSRTLYQTMDIPDVMLDVLYSYVAMNIIIGVDGNTQFRNNLVSEYNLKIKDLKSLDVELSRITSLDTSKLEQKKGFY